MADTSNLLLPLLAAAQAQKHVTVNEALQRLDAMTQLRLQSSVVTIPPVAFEGQCWYVPTGAVNAWAGQAGKIAAFIGGGWVFVTPDIGWHAYIKDEAADAVFDGSNWRRNSLALSPTGAGSAMRAVDFVHTINTGTTSTTSYVIPSNSMVFGVTGRVTSAITGSLTSWKIGVSGFPDRFGSELGLAAGSFLRGVLATPNTEYNPIPLLLTAQGGNFSGGAVRIVVHYLELSLPNP